MSAPARPFRRERFARRETRLALVPSTFAQADVEARHSLPVGGQSPGTNSQVDCSCLASGRAKGPCAVCKTPRITWVNR